MTATPRPWTIRGSEAFDIHSTAIGDTLSIGVWRPDPQILAAFGKTVERFGIVYLLDGTLALGPAATTCLLQLADLIRPGFPPLLLVGIDYPEGRPNARTRDYTMADAVAESFRAVVGTGPENTPGGAERFLTFLETELDPLIRSRYPTTNEPAGILGDSFGATFTFFAFLRQSPLFNRYWLGSPGLMTTETDYIARLEPVLQGSLVHDTRMFLSLGELEASGGIWFYEDLGKNYQRLTDLLTARPNSRLTWAAKTYPGHTHTTVLAPALSDALLYLYGAHFPG
jgi:predicted alpha/beta superfamily hydrolase